MGEPLTAVQRSELLAIFARHAGVIDRVDLFGSRARGTFRPGADVDLVVRGTGIAGIVAELSHAIEDSDLSLFADLVVYPTSDQRLRREIDRDAVPLFSKADLLAASKGA